MNNKVNQITDDECVKCSVATLLWKRYDEVPNFMKLAKSNNSSWLIELQNWLGKEHSLEVLDHTLKPDVDFYLGIGESNNGQGHCVVMYKGEIWHDPSGIGIKKFDSWITIKWKIATDAHGSGY